MTELPSKTARRNALDRFDLYGSERTFQLVWLMLIALMMLFTRTHLLVVSFHLCANGDWTSATVGPCKPKYEARAEGHRSGH
jgi:hypothetical protein